jgi:hypothetical protein
MSHDFDPTSVLFYARVEREHKAREEKELRKKQKKSKTIPAIGIAATNIAIRQAIQKV